MLSSWWNNMSSVLKRPDKESIKIGNRDFFQPERCIIRNPKTSDDLRGIICIGVIYHQSQLKLVILLSFSRFPGISNTAHFILSSKFYPGNFFLSGETWTEFTKLYLMLWRLSFALGLFIISFILKCLSYLFLTRLPSW